MASSQPLHSRLDALLEKFADRDESGGEEDAEYLDFVSRRAQTRPGEPHAEFQLHEPESDYGLETALDENYPIDEDLQSAEIEREEQGPKTPEALVRDPLADIEDALNDLSNAQPSSPLSPASPQAVKDHDFAAEMYREAGLSPRSEPPKERRKTAKQVQKDIEEAARENQQMERTYGEEIGVHTVKTRTVDSFLAGLSDEEDNAEVAPALPGDTQLEADQADKARFRQIVSSPPKMPGLRSFISKPEPHMDGDSDSDLEVIPETKTNRISRPVREMLKFSSGGGTPSDRKLALERSKLLRLQREQIAARRNAKLDELRQFGLDVDDMAEKLAESRSKNSMSAQALLEQERERADVLRQEEQSEEDSESDLEIEQVHRQKKLLSDDSDEEESNGGPVIEPHEVEATEDYTIPASRTDTGMDQGRQADSYAIGRTGTQYVEPLPQHALAKMLGVSDEESNSQSAAAETQVESQLESQEESQAEILDIVSSGQNQMQQLVKPDLTDLRDKDLPLAQRMAEVRTRYLKAQAEQRRQETALQRAELQHTSNKPSPKLRSKFLEDQAEESDDEEHGSSVHRQKGDDDDDDDNEDADAELQGLVDHGRVSVKESELRRQYLEEEKVRDERELNKLMDGVRGGFRRQRRGEGDQFLSDDDLDFEDDEGLETYRKMVESRRKSSLVSRNSGVAKLAENSRAAAFLTSISEDVVSRPATVRKSSLQESLGFLRSVAERDGEFVAPQPLAPLLDGEQTMPEEAGESANHDLLRTNLAIRRTSTIRVPKRAQRGAGTYASHISATDVGNAKTVQILQSMNRPSEAKPKKRYIAPVVAPRPKRTRHPVAAGVSTKSESFLFKRRWT